MIAEQLNRAQADLTEALAEVQRTEAGINGSETISATEAAERHTRAVLRRSTLEARIRILNRQLADQAAEQAEQAAAQAERDRVERENASRLRAGGRALEDSRLGLVAAVAAAEEALTALHHRAVAHGELVEQQRAAVAAMGLMVGMAPGGTPHATGAYPRGLQLEGRTWRPVEPGDVLLRTVQGVTAATLGLHHPLSVRLRNATSLEGGKLADLLQDAPKAPGRRK
jgi:multidrug efflux pump subunit AcrA (membrane-fusion protein)